MVMFSSLLATGLAAGLQASADPKLKIGEPAPPIQVARWFKGQPVTRLETGQIYVVEFWATWCGPCRKNIPHLSELAKAFDGKAHIIGVSVWESEQTDHDKRLAAVGAFVEEMGDQMTYLVAADDNTGSMAANWMEAACEQGIPTAFIVGRDGRIAWIGNPSGGLDQALEATVAGTLDPKASQAAAAARQKIGAERAQRDEWLKPVSDLRAQGNPAEAVAALDRVVAEHPELAGSTGLFRFRLLMAYDQPAAYRLVRELLAGELKNNANGLYMVARDLTDPPGPQIKDWEVAMAVCQRACELSRFSNPSHLGVLAEAYAGKADYAKAIETLTLALAKAEVDASFPEGSKKYLQRRLESFKKGASAAHD
jgi:thiol-disulfide isomerase/thioredoxin